MTTLRDDRKSTYGFRRCGDTGLLLEVESNEHVHALAQALRAAEISGIVDVIPAMHTVLLIINPCITDLKKVAGQVRSVSVPISQPGDFREVTIPVVYEGEDLESVASYTTLSVDEIICAHTRSRWHVAFCGFAPGFAYLVGGDSRLQVPRRGESRVRVPAGSVGLAGSFSSIYPRESPGGWQLIGRTDMTLWDTSNNPPALLTPGTVVRFERVEP